MKDYGSIIAIILLCVVIALSVALIGWKIHEVNQICFDVKVVSITGDVGFYHCDYYYTQKDSYELYLHDKSKLVLMKNDISNIYFVEVKDCERKK